MRKILITQLDSSYFLNETLTLIERHSLNLRDTDITIFCQKEAIEKLALFGVPKAKLVTDLNLIIDESFDIWFNLSVFNFDKNFIQLFNCKSKKGAHLSFDDWSTYLLNIKEKSLYLNIHLQDIYGGVLALPNILATKAPQKMKRVVFGHFKSQVLSFQELTNLTSSLKKSYPELEFQTIDEVDYLESHHDTLYIGPAGLEAIKLSESGSRSVFISTHFTGMNLIPYDENCLFITTHGESILSKRLEPFIHYAISNQTNVPHTGYALYQSEINSGGIVFNSLNQSDDQFATYQSFFVLWSYLLGLKEVDLDLTHVNQAYAPQFRYIYSSLEKISKLNHYALVNAQEIHLELKKNESHLPLIAEKLEKIIDIEKTFQDFSKNQLWFNPLYQFFQSKLQQLDTDKIVESSEERFYIYAQFQQSLEALSELLAVTLNKNEVSIK